MWFTACTQFEFQNFSNNDYDINDDIDNNNNNNDHKNLHQEQEQRYLIFYTRLLISMNMAVKSGLYGLLPSVCVFYILSLTWRCSSFQLHVSKSFMFLLGPQLYCACLILNLLFILREIHPGFLNSRFLSLENSFLNAVVSLIIRHMMLTTSPATFNYLA